MQRDLRCSYVAPTALHLAAWNFKMNSHEFQCDFNHQKTNFNHWGSGPWEAQVSRDGTDMSLLGCAAWLGIPDIFVLPVEVISLPSSFPEENIPQPCVWLSICPPLPLSLRLFALEVDTPKLDELPLLQQSFVIASEHQSQFMTASSNQHRAFPFALSLQKTCCSEIQNEQSPTS